MSRMHILLCLVGIVLMWNGWSAAEEDKDHICFRKIDANRDGKVTQSEFSVHYGDNEKKFKIVDSDGDGQLTHDEYHTFLGHGREEK